MKKIEDFQKKLSKWDQEIRQGQVQEVRDQCLKINSKTIPRELRFEFAQIARRVGEPALIIRWLRPIVRIDKPIQQPATDMEKAIYAAGLVRLGAFREAEEIFKNLSCQENPEIYFLKASLYINQWEYKKASIELKHHINHKLSNSYSKLVSRLNLCSALVLQKKLNEARIQIQALSSDLSKKEEHLLFGNLLEIQSNLKYLSGDMTGALTDLENASKILQKADPRSLLYVKKWQTLISLRKVHDQTKIHLLLDQIKNQAIQIRDWETARDCDLQLAILTQDKEIFLKVYWGSIFFAYKKRALLEFNPKLKLEKHYIWHFHNSDQSSPDYDLVKAAPTLTLKKLFFVLTREFYRPLRSTEIIDILFPNEYLNIISSPAKLHRLVSRGRQWLKQMKLPVDIEVNDNEIKLIIEKPCRLHLFETIQNEKVIRIPNGLKKLPYFSVADWVKLEHISSSTALRRIKELIKKKEVRMIHSGKAAKYKFLI